MLRRIPEIALMGVITMLLWSPAIADGPPLPLERPVSVAGGNGPLSEYLIAIFKSAGIFGGVAIVNDKCEDLSGRYPEFKGTVQGALEKLTSTGYPIRWLQTDGVLVVRNTPSLPPLLASAVQEFRFSRKESLARLSSALLDSPGARKTATDFQLVEYGPELGFAQTGQPTTPSDIVTLTNTTVLDALNKIGSNRGVWLYKESRCGRNLMSVNWPIR